MAGCWLLAWDIPGLDWFGSAAIQVIEITQNHLGEDKVNYQELFHMFTDLFLNKNMLRKCATKICQTAKAIYLQSFQK